MNLTRVQVVNPPSAAAAIRGRAGAMPWPALLAEATTWLLDQPGTPAWLVDCVATGESEACYLTRIAEVISELVVIAASPATIDGDLPLIAAASRPVAVLWAGEAASGELFLELENVRAVCLGEPERGLLAAAAIESKALYPSDPLPDLDVLPRPYRDYSVHRYRLPLPGLPDGPQLIQQAGRGPGRRHGCAWLADDLAHCRRAYPRLTHLVYQDTDLASEAGYLAELGAMLAAGDFPFALRLTLDGEVDPAAWEPLARAAALEVRLAREPEPAEVSALTRLASAGVALSLVAIDSGDYQRLGDEIGAAEVRQLIEGVPLGADNGGADGACESVLQATRPEEAPRGACYRIDGKPEFALGTQDDPGELQIVFKGERTRDANDLRMQTVDEQLVYSLRNGAYALVQGRNPVPSF